MAVADPASTTESLRSGTASLSRFFAGVHLPKGPPYEVGIAQPFKSHPSPVISTIDRGGVGFVPFVSEDPIFMYKYFRDMRPSAAQGRRPDRVPPEPARRRLMWVEPTLPRLGRRDCSRSEAGAAPFYPLAPARAHAVISEGLQGLSPLFLPVSPALI